MELNIALQCSSVLPELNTAYLCDEVLLNVRKEGKVNPEYINVC